MSEDNVYQIDDYRSHVVGECKCLTCSYEWVQVGKEGVTFFPCPRCGLHKGLFKHPFGLCDGDIAFHCECCDGDLFTIYIPVEGGAKQLMCINCGSSEYIDALD